WRLDERDPLLSPPFEPAHAHEREWPAVRPKRPDPARTFFSLMLLLALSLGGLVVASQLRRDGAAVRCVVVGAPGLPIHVDGRDVGLRTRAGGTTVRLPPGVHRVGLRRDGRAAAERAVEVETGSMCE